MGNKTSSPIKRSINASKNKRVVVVPTSTNEEKIENASSNDQIDDNNFKDLDHCNLKMCESIQHLKQILHFMHVTENDDNCDEFHTEKLLIEYIEKNQYKDIINDYQHIITKHLNHQQAITNSKSYAIINEIMTKLIKCDITNCRFYGRNGRDREQDGKDKIINNDNTQQHDQIALFYIDLLDNIHTYFVHSYDTGFRVKLSDITDDEKTNDNTNDDRDITCDDKQMKSLRTAISTKRNKIEQIRGKGMLQNNKFLTKITTDDKTEKTFLDKLYQSLTQNKDILNKNEINELKTYLNQNQFDSDGVIQDLASTEQSNIYHYFATKNPNFFQAIKQSLQDFEPKEKKNVANDISYSFGYKFYYWSYFKDNMNEDTIYHPGEKYGAWYINKKYNSFKEEILNLIDINLYNNMVTRCKEMMKDSKILKKMKSRGGTGIPWYEEDFVVRQYGIVKDTPLSLQNVMSIKFYTDFTDLSFNFCLSFRKKSTSETDKSLKDRNSHWWHWSKFLHETVHLYGNKLVSDEIIEMMDDDDDDDVDVDVQYETMCKEPVIPVLYHGVSMMYFNSFVTRFISPISTTRQIEVATIFATSDGIILEIEQHKPHNAYYFNCSLVSCFGNEDERLFIGGAGFDAGGLVQLRSIRNMKTAENYLWFVRIISFFNIVIKGLSLPDLNSGEYKRIFKKRTKWYYKHICGLINDAKDPKYVKKYPKYIKMCFKKFVLNTKMVKVSLRSINKFYPEFKELLTVKFSNVIENTPLLLFDYVCDTFPNCTEIEYDIGFSNKIQAQSTIGTNKKHTTKEVNASIVMMEEILKILTKMDKNHTKLNKIVLKKVYCHGMVNLEKWKLLFDKKQNWCIEYKGPKGDNDIYHIYRK